MIGLKPGVASASRRRYSAGVTVSPVAGTTNPINSRRNSATMTIAGAFFTPAMFCHGGLCGGALALAGFLESRSWSPRTARHQLPHDQGVVMSSNQTLGASPMTKRHTLTLNPSALRQRAAAHRAMALAALRANSSLSVRLSRYNHHIDLARSLEAQEVAL